MVARSLFVFAPLVLPLLFGCSSDPATTSTSSDAATTSATGGGAGQGGNGSGGAGDGGMQVIDKGPTGSILADADATNDGAQTLIAAGFQRSLPAACVTATDANCKFVDCSAATGVYLAAGTLTVTGASMPISVDPLSNNGYDYEVNDILWGSAKPLTFDFAGSADVPQFSIAATSPIGPLVTKPNFADLATLKVVRVAGLDLAWSGLTTEVAQVLFVGGNAQIQLLCSYDGSLGQATVPSSMLERLDPSENDWTITFRSNVVATAKAGDFDVTLNLATRGETSNGTGADGQIMLQ